MQAEIFVVINITEKVFLVVINYVFYNHNITKSRECILTLILTVYKTFIQTPQKEYFSIYLPFNDYVRETLLDFFRGS